MSTGFYLLDHPNPNGNHFYTVRAKKLIAQVMHITAGLEDNDLIGPDHSAESVVEYAATTPRSVSWHSSSDTDTVIHLLPYSYTAWQCVNYNSSTAGHEISKLESNWEDDDPKLVTARLNKAAEAIRPNMIKYNIPFRKATKTEVDHAIATQGAPVGLISHGELDPDRRTDPGWVWRNGEKVDTFPWNQFITILKNGPQEVNKEDDWMADPTAIELLKSIDGTLKTILTQGFRSTNVQGEFSETTLNNSVRGVNGKLNDANKLLTQLVENTTKEETPSTP